MISGPVLRKVAVLAAAAALASVRLPQAAASPVVVDATGQFLLIGISSGYLGVDIRDVDAERAGALKLKEARGAEIVALDHDAPAAKSGLRVHDVIESMDGQPIESADALRRAMRDLVPGKRVTIGFSRHGKLMGAKLRLADRELLAQQAWARHFSVPEPEPPPAVGSFASQESFAGNGLVAPTPPPEFLAGVTVDPLGPQLGQYFGVHDGSGLLVKSVEWESPADSAGLRAGDIILRVNGTPVAHRSEWREMLRASDGKALQLTVLRSRRTLVITLVPSAAGGSS